MRLGKRILSFILALMSTVTVVWAGGDDDKRKLAKTTTRSQGKSKSVKKHSRKVSAEHQGIPAADRKADGAAEPVVVAANRAAAHHAVRTAAAATGPVVVAASRAAARHAVRTADAAAGSVVVAADRTAARHVVCAAAEPVVIAASRAAARYVVRAAAASGPVAVAADRAAARHVVRTADAAGPVAVAADRAATGRVVSADDSAPDSVSAADKDAFVQSSLNNSNHFLMSSLLCGFYVVEEVRKIIEESPEDSEIKEVIKYLFSVLDGVESVDAYCLAKKLDFLLTAFIERRRTIMDEDDRQVYPKILGSFIPDLDRYFLENMTYCRTGNVREIDMSKSQSFSGAPLVYTYSCPYVAYTVKNFMDINSYHLKGFVDCGTEAKPYAVLYERTEEDEWYQRTFDGRTVKVPLSKIYEMLTNRVGFMSLIYVKR